MLTHEQSTIALDLVGATGLEAEMCALRIGGRPEHIMKTTTRAATSTVQAEAIMPCWPLEATAAANQTTGHESPCAGYVLTFLNHRPALSNISGTTIGLTDFELLQPALPVGGQCGHL